MCHLGPPKQSNAISRLKTQISASQLLTDPLQTFIGNIGAMAEIRDSIQRQKRDRASRPSIVPANRTGSCL